MIVVAGLLLLLPRRARGGQRWSRPTRAGAGGSRPRGDRRVVGLCRGQHSRAALAPAPRSCAAATRLAGCVIASSGVGISTTVEVRLPLLGWRRHQWPGDGGPVLSSVNGMGGAMTGPGSPRAWGDQGSVEVAGRRCGRAGAARVGGTREGAGGGPSLVEGVRVEASAVRPFLLPAPGGRRSATGFRLGRARTLALPATPGTEPGADEMTEPDQAQGRRPRRSGTAGGNRP